MLEVVVVLGLTAAAVAFERKLQPLQSWWFFVVVLTGEDEQK